LNVKSNHPEELIESRTSWNEMKNYADGLYWFIDSLISDVAINKIMVSQKQWMPSDEQIRPLEYAIDYFKKKKNDTTYLESLYQDLKKLRQE
jgi:hypothetical protein